MRLALDSNILVYAEGVNGEAMKAAAVNVVQRLPPEETLLPVQALGELFAVLVKKARRAPGDAQRAIVKWGDAFPLIETSSDVLIGALDLAADHQLSIWDAVMMAAARDGRCRLLLSEDLQEGFTWGGVTVTNPFATPLHPLLESMLAS